MAGDQMANRFWSKVDRRASDECWLWTGALGRKGYGKFWTRDWRGMATHIALELDARPRPGGGFIACHTCDNPPCVNPALLWWGTYTDNARDMARKGRCARHNASKTHCPRGHPYNEANTYFTHHGWRNCRPCNREAAAAYTQRRQAALPMIGDGG